MDTWTQLDYHSRMKLRTELYEWLKSQRMQNYGYDERMFKSLSNKAYHLRKKLKSRLDINIKSNFGIYNRLMVNNNKISYCVGQSFNEEYITLLECFLGENK